MYKEFHVIIQEIPVEKNGSSISFFVEDKNCANLRCIEPHPRDMKIFGGLSENDDIRMQIYDTKGENHNERQHE